MIFLKYNNIQNTLCNKQHKGGYIMVTLTQEQLEKLSE